VNNAAKIRYRWGGSVPMVGAYAVGRTAPCRSVSFAKHEAWFYRTPGLKIVVPSTPETPAP
jgi:2-oxoisovalerate dehydrogenase E1 component